MKDIFEKTDNFALYKDVASTLLYGSLDAVRQPKVSVLMPVFNHPDYFRKALASAVNQDYEGEYEIVVVDNNDQGDGPTECQRVVEECGSPKVLYYRNARNIGMFGNWNRCIELARADFVTYCHDDDMLLPTCLSRLMALQRKHGEKAIFSKRNMIDENDNIIVNKTSFSGQRLLGVLRLKDSLSHTMFDLLLSSTGCLCGSLFSRRCLLETGGFNAEYYPSSDYALEVIYVQRFGGVYNNTPTFCYRVAENESYAAYEKFCEMDHHIHDCMKLYICLPSRLVDRINRATYNLTKIYSSIAWGGKDPAVEKRKRRFSDKKLIAFLKFARKLRKWELSL